MKSPEINALPFCEWTPQKAKWFKWALICLPLFSVTATIRDSLDMTRIPAEVFSAAYNLVVVTILYYVRNGMETFYRPYRSIWMAMMALLAVSAVLNLCSIGNDNIKSPAIIAETIAGCAAYVTGFSLCGKLASDYTGLLAVMGSRLKKASIFYVILNAIALVMLVSVDSSNENALAVFTLAGLPILAIAVILEIRAMFTAIEMFDNGAELGWDNAIYMPEGTGHPVDNNRE